MKVWLKSLVLSLVVVSVLSLPCLKAYFPSFCSRELSQLIGCFKRSFLILNLPVMRFIIVQTEAVVLKQSCRNTMGSQLRGFTAGKLHQENFMVKASSGYGLYQPHLKLHTAMKYIVDHHLLTIFSEHNFL